MTGAFTATIEVLHFTLAGSVLMLAAVIFLYIAAFDYANPDPVAGSRLALTSQAEIPIVSGILHRVHRSKVPLFPAPHLAARRPRPERPPASSIGMLASVMCEMGAYGLVRFTFTPAIPNAAHRCAHFRIIRSCSHRHHLHGALVALVQPT